MAAPAEHSYRSRAEPPFYRFLLRGFPDPRIVGRFGQLEPRQFHKPASRPLPDRRRSRTRGVFPPSPPPGSSDARPGGLFGERTGSSRAIPGAAPAKWADRAGRAERLGIGKADRLPQLHHRLVEDAGRHPPVSAPAPYRRALFLTAGRRISSRQAVNRANTRNTFPSTAAALRP